MLFDTLITQLGEAELEAVLAHEMGHYKLGHIPKRLAWSALMLFGGFWLIAWLLGKSWFAGAFGFGPDAGLAPTLLFGLLSGAVGFWLSPLLNHWSRVHEFEADAFAARTVGETTSLVGALRKLSEKNLSNLTPHPWFSAWHYSHPTLVERETALHTGPVGGDLRVVAGPAPHFSGREIVPPASIVWRGILRRDGTVSVGWVPTLFRLYVSPMTEAGNRPLPK